MLTLAGGAEVISLSFLGLFLFPTLFLEKAPAVADQFLKRETMTVHQVWGAAGMPCPCSKLARVETIWVMMTDSTVDSGGAADGLSQHGCCQACDDRLAGKDRHMGTR